MYTVNKSQNHSKLHYRFPMQIRWSLMSTKDTFAMELFGKTTLFKCSNLPGEHITQRIANGHFKILSTIFASLELNCLLLLLLFINLGAVAERKFPIICADKSPYCKRRSHLCQSNAFRSVMQSLCKKTCNLCEDRRKKEVIEDSQHEKESSRDMLIFDDDDID
uniref:ShKT domain-containing protein n=1 Tax=Elaeophora elaphi TaxID=1147741 RepID=A0A0R3RYQ8_9BILA